MNNDFEQLLKKVAVPVGGRARLVWLGRFRKYVAGFDLRNRAPRLKLLKMVSIVILAGVILFIVSWSGKALKIHPENKKTSDNELINKIGELIVLPDEVPIVATVVDYEKLAENSFFDGAKDGDKVLMFRKSDQAILYDIDRHRIINVRRMEDVGVEINNR